MNFLRRGVTLACLKIEGKVDSVKQRFKSIVIGGKRASRQDFRSQVGMMSREQEELGEERMRDLTSSSVVGAKLDKRGGATSGAM